MFAKRLLQKVRHSHPQHNLPHGNVMSTDLELRIALHYGIPSTSSVLAFDPIQRLLAIGTLDGRIKVIGGDNIEGLLISPKQLPYKNLEFLHNHGFLVSISNENDIQVWDLENRCIASSLQWESNITAFSVIFGTYFMYIGDEYGLMSVLKYDVEERKLLQLPYNVPAKSITEAAGVSLPNHQSIVCILPQPSTSGNRMLIAYQNGLMILWDVSEAKVVLVRGYKDLQLKDGVVVDSLSGPNNEILDSTSDHEQEEKEISSLCWVSSNGSIIAVGYVDGDILLWNLSSTSSIQGQQAGISSNSVVKLQLSSGKRRIPIIVLHWSANSRSHNDCRGQLFIYGGDEIGSEEVLTVLNLEWSSGIETLRCIGRVDLTLNGSFADMILIPDAGAVENGPFAALFVLTNPGQLHVYDDVSLSALMSRQEKSPSVSAMQFPVVIPIVGPYMTATKFSSVPVDENFSKALLEIASVKTAGATSTLTASSKWLLTGGVPSQTSCAANKGIERVYIAGYQDGSVRIWDATYPVLSLIFVLEGEVQGIKVAGASASITALDFCSLTKSLAIGNACGLVRIYKLSESSNETSFYFVIENKHEVHSMHQGKGFQYTAAVSILNSPIQTLKYANLGTRLAIGFDCGQVAMLDMSSLSVLFLTDCVSSSRSPVISMDVKTFPIIGNLINTPKNSGSKSTKDPAEELVFILTKDSHVIVVDSVTGNIISTRPMHKKKESTAISMYVIESSISVSKVFNENHPEQLSKDNVSPKEPEQTNVISGVKPQEVELQTSSESKSSGEKLLDPLVLLCSKDTLRLYSLKSVMQGDNKSIQKVKLARPCCWTTTFKKKDEKPCGLILLYQTGVIEIRSLPDLEILRESSLMSILRWSFKTNMDKTMSSDENGHITLVNECELAFISFLACENDFRIPESLPCLHDKVLAAAADAAISFSSNQKKKQGISPGIFGGIIKGLKGGKVGSTEKLTESLPKSIFAPHLESMFSRVPFSDSTTATIDDQEVVELNIDDIDIDEPMPVASTSSHKGKKDSRDKETEREKLFEGASADMKPRLRTPEEIIAKYRFAGDVSAAAAQAKDKLMQRQEKLERISRRTEELQNGAESFAEMANELVKVMESRKWWQI